MKIASFCFCALALALAVSAQNAEDAVVPESTQEVEPLTISFVETAIAAQEAETAAAHQEATSYLAKAGAGACKALADSAEKAVVDNVKAQKAILDKMDKGANCPNEGQQAVTQMKTALNQAKDKLKKADKAYNDAQNADVDWGNSRFNSVKPGNCNVFFNSQAYKNAAKKVADAKKKAEEAKGKVTQGTKALADAEAAARVAVKTCECSTFKAHQQALAAANEKVKAANEKSWTKAAHLKCVLAGTAASSCTVPPLPKVTATTLAKGVDATKCSLWKGKYPQCKGVSNFQAPDNGFAKKNSIRQYTKAANVNQWDTGCYLETQINYPMGSGGMRLFTTWQASGNGGSQSSSRDAIWGVTDMPNGKHQYGNLKFSFYCQTAGSLAQIYELGKWHGTSSNNNCRCGDSGNTFTQFYFNPDGSVNYKMKSNHHDWKTCRTAPKGSATGSYVADQSLYGQRAAFMWIKMEQLLSGQWKPAH